MAVSANADGLNQALQGRAKKEEIETKVADFRRCIFALAVVALLTGLVNTANGSPPAATQAAPQTVQLSYPFNAKVGFDTGMVNDATVFTSPPVNFDQASDATGMIALNAGFVTTGPNFRALVLENSVVNNGNAALMASQTCSGTQAAYSASFVLVSSAASAFIDSAAVTQHGESNVAQGFPPGAGQVANVVFTPATPLTVTIGD